MSNARRKWLWCVYENTPGVMISAGLHRRFAAAMKRVGKKLSEHPAQNPNYSKEMFLDEPGMVCTDRPIEEFDFLGLKLRIPSEDVDSFLYRIERLVPNGGWYELHGFHRCLVLTDWQRIKLASVLRERVTSAVEKARIFWADREPMHESLRKANADALGVPVDEIPDLGGHKNDRHLPRERGAA